MDLTCVTCNPGGTAPEGSPTLISIRPPSVAGAPPAAILSRNLSQDGNRFFFETKDALVSQDTNGEDGCPEASQTVHGEFIRPCQDVYEWEASGTGSCHEDSPAYSTVNDGCIYLISTGKSDRASYFGDADLDGNNVFVFTYEQLVGQDEDALLDVYDARVNGGFDSQNEVKAPDCDGEACKALPVNPPASQAPGSAGFTGPGDSTPERPHKKKQRKHKKHKHTKHKKKHGTKGAKGKKGQRAAKTSRGAGR
jgi:hypothetical protein